MGRTESPETARHVCSRMIPSRAPGPCSRERRRSPTSGAGTPDIHVQRNEGDTYLTPHTKINAKRDGGPNCRARTIKLQTQTQSNSFVALGVAVVARVWHQKQEERDAHRPTDAGQESVPGNANIASVPTQEVIQAQLRDLAQRGNPERAELREQRKEKEHRGQK